MNRRGFIGGSDAVKIMAGDWLPLWLVKTGREESDDLSDNIAVQLGIHTEPFNIQWFGNHTRLEVIDQQRQFHHNHDDVPIVGTVDGMIKGANAILECKHTNSHNTMTNLSKYYMPQLQTYMHIANADGCYLSAIFGNSKWESAYIEYNADYTRVMMDHIKTFWAMVKSDTRPDGVEIEQPDTDAIKINGMKRRDAQGDNQFTWAAQEYVDNIEPHNKFESAKKMLKELIQPDEREVYCDFLTVTRDKRGAIRIKEIKNNE